MSDRSDIASGKEGIVCHSETEQARRVRGREQAEASAEAAEEAKAEAEAEVEEEWEETGRAPDP
jgi:hypothetical protein